MTAPLDFPKLVRLRLAWGLSFSTALMVKNTKCVWFFFFLGRIGNIKVERKRQRLYFKQKVHNNILCVHNTISEIPLHPSFLNVKVQKYPKTCILLQQSSLEFVPVDAKRFLKYEKTIHTQGHSV